MDKLQRYYLRFCFLVVFLAICLTPFTVYADEIDTVGTLVDLVVRNPSNLADVYYYISGDLDTGFYDNDISTGGGFDLTELAGNRYLVLDYTLYLPFDVPVADDMDFIWNTNGAFYNYVYAAQYTSMKYYFRFEEAEKCEFMLDDALAKEFVAPFELSMGGTNEWTSMSFYDIPVESDAKKITLRWWFPLSSISIGNDGETLDERLDKGGFNTTYTFGTLLNSTSLSVRYSVEDPNAGLLAGIIEWLQSIVNNITELPGRIWGAVESGLQNLFVPDAEFMKSYKSEWDAVLQDSMGGVYQSVSMIDEFYESFKVSRTQGTIQFPEVSVPVAGETFKFGGYEVDIVPDEAPFLQVVIDGIKLVMNAVCTLAVLQSFKRRYERVVSE